MNRVTSAIREGRAVLAFGAKTLGDGRVTAEISRLAGLPMVALGGDPQPPVQALSAEAIAAATSRGGGVMVLLDPSPSSDGRALEELSRLLKSAKQKPRIFVVTRQFNPFALPMGMRMMKLEGLKSKVPDFLQQLPVVAAPAAPGATPAGKKSKKKSGPAAPKPVFVGREEELAALKPLLGQGGPLVLLGRAGVGRRYLLEKALSELGEEGAGLKRAPDFVIQNGSEFDSLMARIAELTGLAALAQPGPPAERIKQCVEALADEKMAGTVMLISGLHRVQGRDGSMYRNDRLGMLIETLLTSSYAARLVFRTHRRPIFYGQGQTAGLEIFEVGGLKGKELHAIFDAYHVEDLDRSRMGPLHSHSDGHPVVARVYAIALRDARDDDQREALWDAKRMPRLGGSMEPLARYLKKRVDKLKGELRKALSAAAHAVTPVSGRELADLGVSRSARIALQRLGYLEVLPYGEERRYYVHELIAGQLQRREVSDFATMEERGRYLVQQAEGAQGVERLAMLQEANRLFTGCRRIRSRVDLPHLDQDAVLETLRPMIRSERNANYDLAAQRVAAVLRIDASNTDAYLLKAELLVRRRAPAAEIDAVYSEALQAAPLPEVYHHQAGYLLKKRSSRGKAIAVLERGAEAYPTDARIRRRLSRLHMLEGELARAEDLAREAMDLEPTMPDTYSLLGAIYTEHGPERWPAAEEALREALRLDPEGVVNQVRLGRLQRLRGLVDAENRATLWAEAREILEAAVKAGGQRSVQGAALELAWLLLDMNEDGARAEWLLHKRLHPLDPQYWVKLARARAMSRTKRQKDAEAILQKMHRKDNTDSRVLAAMAELEFHRSKVYKAADLLKQAVDLAPEGAPEKGFYTEELVRLQLLVTSGAALDIEKRAEAELEEQVRTEGEGARRDPGTTTIRRKAQRRAAPTGDAPTEDASTEDASTGAAPVDGLAALSTEELPTEVTMEIPEPDAEEPSSL